MRTVKNTVTYHISRESFYTYTNSKKLSPGFETYLMDTIEALEYVETQRSKRIYYENGKGIWNIHLPNPGIAGKNAFRMLCFINTRHRQIILCYLFPRETLQYKGAKKKLGQER